LFDSIIDACKFSNIGLYLSNDKFNNIYSQISLSVSTPNARNTINSGIGCLTRGICKEIGNPKPLFFELIIIFICLGDIHLKSGTDFISAFQVYFVSFLETLKQ